ncbi:MAG: HEAT repeat domain-containing protein [Halieaceae bacterium]|nr:HEAT repeat domain-containing protein [Halieaceae bacterium]
MAVGDLSNEELLVLLAEANLSNVESLCTEVVNRSLDTAVPALVRLWRRFTGYGMKTPLLEQVSVLKTLAKLESLPAQTALRQIVLSVEVQGALLGPTLAASVDACLNLPEEFIAPLLQHENPYVRESAFQLADRAGITGQVLRDGLADPFSSVRRAAAITLGLRGDTTAKEILLRELRGNPSSRVIEAIAEISDDDMIVHLGRCAMSHPVYAAGIIKILREMENPRADKLADHISNQE